MATASVDQLYHSSLRGLALDLDEIEPTYTLLDGPDWLSIDEDGMLSGTPSLSDVGFYTWTLQATDSTGQTAVSQLELRVVDGEALESPLRILIPQPLFPPCWLMEACKT